MVSTSNPNAETSAGEDGRAASPEFTPGPWKVVKAWGGYIPEHACAFEIQQVSGTGYVLAAIITDASELRKQGAATARLIAAAPMLLKSLKELHLLCDSMVTGNKEFSFTWRETVRNAGRIIREIEARPSPPSSGEAE